MMLTSQNLGWHVGQRQNILMQTITPQAEDQAERLDAPDRLKLVEVLRNPVRSDHCELVTRLAKYRVFHFSVTGTIRASFRRFGGKACVLHVGTHPEYDKFADRYLGNVPNKMISIEESTFMNNPRNSIQPNPPAPPAAITPTPAADEAELISQAILGFIGKVKESDRKQIDGNIDAMCELVRTEFVKELGALGEHLKDQQATLEEVQDTIARQAAGVSASIDGLRDDLGSASADFREFCLRVEDRFHVEQVKLTALQDGHAKQADAFSRALSGVINNQGEANAAFAGFRQEIQAELCQIGAKLAEDDSALAKNERSLASMTQAVNDISATVAVLTDRIARSEREMEPRAFRTRFVSSIQAVRSALTAPTFFRRQNRGKGVPSLARASSPSGHQGPGQ